LEYTPQNHATEWSFSSGRSYGDPFDEITLDMHVTDPQGCEQVVPAFWAGEQTWRVRYASPKVGAHRYRTVCSDPGNPDLHGREGTLEVTPYTGSHPLASRGRLRVAADRRHLEYVDGTPFFWLGDTWWMGLCKRLAWPGDFQTLTADRVNKGFTVIQIVAGLYPDMPPFDERGANEAGFPWEKDYTRINPAYFDMADLRIHWLVRSGLVPCVVGGWGYHLPWLGIEKMKQHWRNLIARYGAWPVVWCMAGEATMPYYLSEDRPKDAKMQKQGWTEVTAYVRKTDPYHNPITIHPTTSAREQVEDVGLLDIDMLQTGHGGYDSIPNTIEKVVQAVAAEPPMPVVNGEVCYEGIGDASREQVQRYAFWVCVLSGACGHTYGANGIWQVNTMQKPYGPSPHGMAWGNTPWEEAHQLPGSTQVGLAKMLLERYAWWRFEPHPEWVEPHWSKDSYFQPFAAGIPGEVTVIYLLRFTGGKVVVKGLQTGVSYRASLFNPTNGEEYPLGTAEPDANGDWALRDHALPLYQDWLLVLERA
jgi:hypothetical protein